MSNSCGGMIKYVIWSGLDTQGYPLIKQQREILFIAYISTGFFFIQSRSDAC